MSRGHRAVKKKIIYMNAHVSIPMLFKRNFYFKLLDYGELPYIPHLTVLMTLFYVTLVKLPRKEP